MGKHKCQICGGNAGVNKIQISDVNYSKAFVCYQCATVARKGGIEHLYSGVPYARNITPDDVRDAFNKEIKRVQTNKKRLSRFKATIFMKPYLEIDEVNKMWRIPPTEIKEPTMVYRYSDLIGFELKEDGVTIESSTKKGGVGRAVVGGLLFGGAGAVVGAVTGKKETSSTTYNWLSLFITVNSETKPIEEISQISMNSAQKVMTALQRIKDEVENKTAQVESKPPQPSDADEILKFKSLLDQGIITQEEFDHKKKQLLGM